MSSEVIVIRGGAGSADTSSATFFGKFLLTAVLLLMSGLFFLSDDHRYGAPFIQEGLAASSILCFAYIAIFHRDRMERFDWYMAFLALIVFFVPVFFSYLYFKQPLNFGFLEERRTLLYFSYFFAMFVIGRRQYSSNDIESVLGVVFWVVLIWSALNAYELVPRNQGFSFSAHTEQFAEGFQSEDARYATRFLNGYMMAFMYPYYLLARGKFGKAMLPIIFVVAYMLYVNQTRSLGMMAGLTAITILILRLKKDHLNLTLLFIAPVFFMVLYFLYYLYAYLFGEPVAFYDMYRNLEFKIIFRDTLRDYFMPHGHLSLQFNGGFKTYYGINVYTADVGLAGYLYKYGFFYIPLIAIYIAIVGMLYRRYRNDFNIIMMAAFVAVCLMAPFDEHISRQGVHFAILMTLVKIQGDTYGRKTIKYIARVRRGGASRPSYSPTGVNAVA
ncbi:MAG: hypothetical protein KJ914_17505 [Gammaproteobacteria bacterium]|nr:hypothetical protein [Gammaproteobacteria bacterium]MBU1724330.1 hypothetical protein [Gammaproteobacteria bacterium]MBU2006242.1 hypothetical protein [Gammaproteobacteria bacterium]